METVKERLAASSTIELLTATVGGVRCGFAATDVVAVHHAARPQLLPGAPPIVEGVLNIRGQIVPVLDLRRRLGLPYEPVRAHQHLVVLRDDQRQLAVRVDRAEGVETSPTDAIDPVPPEGESSMVRGVARRRDGLLVIYDPARFLGPAEAECFDAALASWQPSPRSD